MSWGGDDVAARDALRRLRAVRSASREDGERFTDLYVTAFSTVLISVWVLSFARETFLGRNCARACALQEHPTYAALATALLALGALVLLFGAVGPVLAERPVARWLLGTTADRAVLLRGPLLGVVSGGAAVGAVAGLLVVMGSAAGSPSGTAQLFALATGATVGAGVPLLLLVRQRAETRGVREPGRTLGRTLVALGLVVLTWVLLGAAGLPEPGSSGGVAELWWLLPAALVLLDAVLLHRALGQLGDLSDVQLARGREVVDAVSGAALMMDDTLVVQLQRRRRDRGAGRFASRRGHGRGATAFFAADLVQARRRWRSVLVSIVVAVPLCLVAGEGFGYGAAVLSAALLSAWSARRAGQGLRTWVGSPGLRRMVPLSPVSVTLALTPVPAVAAALVAVPTMLLVDAPAWAGAHLAIAGLAATLRAGDVPKQEPGVVVSTPMGALPFGLVAAALHGPDLALGLAVLMVVWPDPTVLALAAATLAWQASRER
ncbi:DUF6297 family protein [Nocardioides houyundeii]|uniref:DUF6297 family protein n=1 Tax=Nocardioides houyundeii TaxID=2045452 RepID=UPI000DF3A77A|nr:DUF6297 family protein [Nocardioides houyundeii]